MARLRLAGVDVRTETEIEVALGGDDGRVCAVRTKHGETIACGLIGIGIGVICNSEFLEGSGVDIGKRKGVIVDEQLQSSAENVFTAGDIAEVNGQLLQLWEPARWQGRIVALNMTGGDESYKPGAHYNATRLYDLDLASVGQISAQNGAEEIVDFPRGAGRMAYRKLIVDDGKLLGALLLGERKERVRQRGRALKRLIDEQADIGAIADKLLEPSFDLNGWLNTNVITNKPKPTRATRVKLPSLQLRRSQMISISPPERKPTAAPRLPARKITKVRSGSIRDVETGRW